MGKQKKHVNIVVIGHVDAGECCQREEEEVETVATADGVTKPQLMRFSFMSTAALHVHATPT
jgi:translation elongation factor EF-Tu-like GTPase